MEEMSGLMNHIFFYIIWGKDSPRMQYRNKASRHRQCDALLNVVLENVGAHAWMRQSCFGGRWQF